MPLEIVTIPCRTDNYAFLGHNPESGATFLVDAPEAGPVVEALAQRGWTLADVLITHHHGDHVEGLPGILEAHPDARVTGAAADARRLPPLDRAVQDGEHFEIAGESAHVIDVSGHTNGHIAFHVVEEGIAFVGDSVFALGCGRMFEGEPEQFWRSLERIKRLSTATVLYCAHEYTQANAKFALHADPDNEALQDYVREIDQKRARGEWTVPTVLKRELETNPFLRADDPAMQAKWGGNAPHETFAALRAAKDNF